MLIIGITGEKQNGKDAVAEIVKQLYGSDRVAHINFADEVYLECAKIVKNLWPEKFAHYSLEHIVAFIKKEKSAFRLLLQWDGTDFRRQLCGQTDHWIHKWIDKVIKIPSNKHILVVSDVRFLNEWNIIKRYNGIIWRVKRKANESMKDHHISENELKEIEAYHTFHNDGTLEELKQQVLPVLHEAIKQHNLDVSF